MAVSIDDVRHIASLARLGLAEPRAAAIANELNTILAHMDELAKVDTAGVQEAIGVGAEGLPVRKDLGPPFPLARSHDGSRRNPEVRCRACS